MDPHRLDPEQLRRHLDPASLPFASTADVSPLQAPLGQLRAMEALQFGVGIESDGYNIFVSGVSGSGRTSIVRSFVEGVAAGRPTPDDWVHVHNFDHPDRPLAIGLPAGRGRELGADMDSFIREARRQITRAFDTERYAERRRQLAAELAQRRDPLLEELGRFAHEHGFAIEGTPSGMITVPIRDDRPLTAEEIQKLTTEEREAIEQRAVEVQTQVAITFRHVNQLEREGAEMLANLDREIARFAIEPLLHGLREKYAGQAAVVAHLDRIGEDVPNHLQELRQSDGQGGSSEQPPQTEAALAADHTNRYRVNVVVDNGELTGAPVVVESNPTYYNLVGRVEYRATFGSMVTDFRQIKCGALQRANGGFLILEAADLLSNPFAWQALVRALSTREVRIENLGDQHSAIPTGSVSPAPIPIRTKVVLIGPPAMYQILYRLDDEFRELFKVRVDFAPDVDWTADSVASFTAFIRFWIDRNQLRHFDRSAVARLVEQSARWQEDQHKLSTRLRDVADLVTESSYWAGQQGHAVVQAEDVMRAITEKDRRSSLTEERLREIIAEGTIRVETAGVRVGQLNGLSVVELGDHRFGMPCRVSASVSVGRGTFESIDRETELGGPIHNKGFLIVSGYLSGKFGQQFPLAMRATLTFEQSYDEIEGDSASSTELYALLSALAGVPLKQSIAVTGSVDQHGIVQAVGGVTDKIEGFFKICKAKGLSGEQGVMIPASNVRNLMLSDEVVDAVRAGRFGIWAVASVDEGIEVLTGLPAGEPTGEGDYPAGSVHGRVAQRLRGYAELQSAFASPPDGKAIGHVKPPAPSPSGEPKPPDA
ncbi:MAG TPA: AAA family ATPase [Candidatus Sulfotelmatobacter sp.]|nr:AAA family ATPase [Candidatus Sulfotelmatobacter sp.]